MYTNKEWDIYMLNCRYREWERQRDKKRERPRKTIHSRERKRYLESEREIMER